jgi:hypothetical protein
MWRRFLIGRPEHGLFTDQLSQGFYKPGFVKQTVVDLASR